MLASQLIQQIFPSLHLSDNAGFALQLMEDYDVQHLPIVAEEKLLGLVAKDDLLDEDDNTALVALEERFVKAWVKKDEFVLTALKVMAEYEITVLPVVTEQDELIGCVSQNILQQHLAKYLGTHEPGGIIVLEIERRNFSFGEINRLVETNDAYITQLNSYTDGETGFVIVSIKVNKVEISDILATFQRYDYIVKYYFGEEQFANELKENYHHLMAYLNL
ncbi:CBS domain-containing protein [Parasediminibacterium paludis]|uniref:CBS domain-containing protein n=1 Tax=Parasediminibacterium paludis TaxID=908966 RepID=A0ABV8PY84_9BACT